MKLELRPIAADALVFYRKIAMCLGIVALTTVTLFGAALSELSWRLMLRAAGVTGVLLLIAVGLSLAHYLTQRHKLWVVSDEGIEVRRRGTESRLLPWPDVLEMVPGQHGLMIALTKGADDETIPFVSEEGKQLAYREWMRHHGFAVGDVTE